jgi:glycosyltransferase involved in cell wall biosynthesis
MKHHKPTVDVSIIVPDYNNGRFLNEFIQSIIHSTVKPRELIIVNDGSTDESGEVLAVYKNLEFLITIQFPINLGLTDALNAGLDTATGKYIMRADPDDILHPERIERQYTYMEAHPEVDVLGSNVWYFHYETGQNINRSNFPAEHDQIVGAYRNGLHGIQHPTAFMKKSVVQGYRYQKIFPGEDYEFFSRMAKGGCRFANLTEPLYRMRVHPASSTSTIKINAIRFTFTIRDSIWGTKTSIIRIYSYYYFIFFYRRYQISSNRLTKYFYLLPAILLNPKSLIKRIKAEKIIRGI